MELKIKSIRGTRDVTPKDVHKWHYVERVARETAETYGMGELRIPTMEKTELFVRGVGDTTDIVQKEMYTFEKGKESITLRPEGTSGAVRAVLENGMLNDTLPQKLYYILSCFRHENPQAGRLREFHQFGVEIFGAPHPSADAETIGVAYDMLNRLGIKNFTLEINSIGCPKCRPAYNQKLVGYYKSHHDELCETCKDRLERNPLRLLDCKEENCAVLVEGAPKITEHLCEECETHFSGLKSCLKAMGIDFSINHKIVRGLDYYTKTVFEFISQNIGSQGTVCGGGRYDGLLAEMGGPDTSAVGYGMGLERIIMLMEASGCEFPPAKLCDIYIGSMGETESCKALELASALRREGFEVLIDNVGRSVKNQMKYADKLNARFSCIIGSDELEKKTISVKNMQTGESETCNLDGKSLIDYLYSDLAESAAEGKL